MDMKNKIIEYIAILTIIKEQFYHKTQNIRTGGRKSQ